MRVSGYGAQLKGEKTSQQQREAYQNWTSKAVRAFAIIEGVLVRIETIRMAVDERKGRKVIAREQATKPGTGIARAMRLLFAGSPLLVLHAW